MDENPVAETQSGFQMKNKKGLGCLSLMPALFVPLIVITWAVVASIDAGCVDENPLPILLAATLTLVLLHRLTRRFRSRGYNLRAIFYWFSVFFCVGVSTPAFRNCYQELSMGKARYELEMGMNECRYRQYKKKDLDAEIGFSQAKVKVYNITRGYTFNAGPKCTYLRASSSDKYLASFSILYDNETKKISRTCTAGEYLHGCVWNGEEGCGNNAPIFTGCFADKDHTIKQKPGKPGYW